MTALKKIIASPQLYLVVRLAVAAVFLYAGLVKLIDPKAFARAISQYDIVPEFFLPVVAVGLPALELLAGAGLVFDKKGSLPIIAGLLVTFCLVLGFAILSDMDIDCGCFSDEELDGRNSLRHAFYRDIVMIAGVIYMYGFRRIRYQKA